MGRRRCCCTEEEAFSPSDIQGLQLWLDASTITGLSDGAAVATWADRSGNSFNATQATEAAKPLYKVNIINGKPVVRFDGSNDSLGLSGTGLNILRNVSGGTVFAVAKSTAVAQQGAVFFAATPVVGTTRLSLRQNATPAWDSFYRRLDSDGSDSIVGAAVDTSPHVLCVVRDYAAATAALFVDGGAGSTDSSANTAGSTSDTASNAVMIGHTSATPFPGDVAEVLVYNRALIAVERKLIQNYLGAKYAIAIAIAA